MRIIYEEKRFSKSSMQIINAANEIIEEYQEQGYMLTLRQLYYQFVSRDLVPNTMQSYKRIGSIVNDGRMAGEIDWDAIEDRTRNVRRPSTWESPSSIMRAVVSQFAIDRWDMQEYRPEVWIEKDALVGVISGVCEEFQVPYFACRGYNSQSEQWAAGQRFETYMDRGQIPIVLHLGDHDPSGIDMTRDNESRLTLFAGSQVDVRRLALNWDQVKRYNPPPNPAKLTDSRADGYIKNFGKDSWELDALEPSVISDLVSSAINDLLDPEQWDKALEKERGGQQELRSAMETMS